MQKREVMSSLDRTIQNKVVRKDMQPSKVMTVEVEHYALAGQIKGRTKQNQDNFFIEQGWKHLGIQVFGLCDGHGDYGHKVSHFIKSHYPPILASFLKTRADLEQIE